MPPIPQPLQDIKFTLNAWGVAGIFGGEEAISAMTLIPLYRGRRWLGWHNSPGSLNVARYFGPLTRSSFWERVFPHTTSSPASLFGLDGEVGPKYVAAMGGMDTQTGHLGYLVMEKCKEGGIEVTQIEGRRTKPIDVVLISMNQVDDAGVAPPMPIADLDTLLAFIPIVVSIVTCVMCVLVFDWYSFSVILGSIVIHGLASIAIGAGSLRYKSVHTPAEGSPPGHGILMGEDTVVVIRGDVRDVSFLTKGKFELDISDTQHAVGLCSLLLIVNFLTILLLVPQGTLFGQLMFVTSLCVSLAYNFHISSFGKGSIQAEILFHALGNPEVRKFRVGTRATTAVFVSLLLFHDVRHWESGDCTKILETFVPNGTPVWRRWNDRIVRQLTSSGDRSLIHLEMDDKDDKDQELSESDRMLLDTLLGDAASAFRGYHDISAKLPLDSSRSI